MKQPVFYLRDERVRDNLIDYIRKLPVNDALPLVVKFSEADRTLAQNDLFHALCGDTAKQLQWAGKSRDLASWKVLYVSGHAIATGKPGEVVPGLEGEFCAIRESTAKMGIRRMTSLIEYSQAFAVQNGVPTTLMALKMDSRTGQVYSFWLSTPADSAAAHDPESLPKEAALRAFSEPSRAEIGWPLAMHLPQVERSGATPRALQEQSRATRRPANPIHPLTCASIAMPCRWKPRIATWAGAGRT